MDKTIIFYAPLGKGTPPDRIGGAEAGCLKTKAIYEEAGYRIRVIEKPAMSKGKVRFAIEMAFIPIRLLWAILQEGKCAPVHIVGFYTKIAKYEKLLMDIAHFCGNKVIYEIRNGSMIQTYKDGNEKYRKALESLLLKPEVVLCQGQEYVDFIRQKWGVERSYYPNYIMDSFVESNNLDRPHPIRLLYFGRVTESKNIDVVIKALHYIIDAGVQANLSIIGGFDDRYRNKLDRIIEKLGIEDKVIFYGRKPFAFIAQILKKSHYFLFPSSEKQEGHSNSLTEAMGCGCVPIVSTAGFNASICGIPELIIGSIDAEAFAAKIIDIEQRKLWSFYSEKAYQRVQKNYTQTIVSKKLIGYIEPLFSK